MLLHRPFKRLGVALVKTFHDLAMFLQRLPQAPFDLQLSMPRQSKDFAQIRRDAL